MHRFIALLGALLLVALAAAAPVAGQVDDPTTSTTVPAPPAPDEDPGADGDAPAVEPPSEDEIPDGDALGHEPSEGSEERRHELIVGSVTEVEARLAEAEATLLDARVRVEDLTALLAAFETMRDDLTRMRSQTVDALTVARARHLDRAVGAYVRGGPPGIEQGLLSGVNGDAEESQLLDSVLQADRDEIARLVARRAELDRKRRGVEDELDKGRVRLTQATAAVEAAEQDVDAGTFAARIFAAGSEVAITGFVFPVGDPHDFIDSWGFPRAGGRSHEGADIFAPRGTPLFAVEDGVLVRVGNDRLGGTKLWLVGESGTHYYYAHLERYAVGVRDGVPVEAGNVIGFVGDTGDAKGTPPHLHFQLHPGGGEPVNPFPLLSVVDQLNQDQAAPARR